MIRWGLAWVPLRVMQAATNGAETNFVSVSTFWKFVLQIKNFGEKSSSGAPTFYSLFLCFLWQSDSGPPGWSSRSGVLNARRSLLPAAAEGLIELDEREPLAELGLNEAEFGAEIVGFAGEHLEITRAAVVVEDHG
jgi:hypothetical protein